MNLINARQVHDWGPTVTDRQRYPCGHEHEAQRDGGVVCCPVCGAAQTENTSIFEPLAEEEYEAELPPPPRSEVGARTELLSDCPSPDKVAASAEVTAYPRIDGYETLAELGRGGMGVVYKARQIALKRVVALKMILTLGPARTEQLVRFRVEAEAAAQLHHPNIVQIYEVGMQGDRPFLALEFVEGGSLAHFLNGTPQPLRAAAAFVETLAAAMHYAHRRGIIHRDLKPANILLERRLPIDDRRQQDAAAPVSSYRIRESIIGIPKITDFGLAKQLHADVDQTRSGVAMGTPSYAAPEQATGQAQATTATDVYSLGAVLYELLTGRPPFRGPTALETVRQVTSEEPVAPSRLLSTVPRDLETICLKCLQKEPGKRYGTAKELAADLRRFLDGRPIIARPVMMVERLWRWCRRNPGHAGLVAALVIVLLTGAAGVLWQWRRAEGAAIQAQRQRDQAETNLALAQETVREVVALVTYLDNTQLFYLSFAGVRQEVLESLMVYYQDFLDTHGDEPQGRVEVANAYFRIAVLKRHAYGIDKRTQTAAEGVWFAAKALELHQALVEGNPGVVQFERDLAASYQILGFLHHLVGHGVTAAESAKALPFLESGLTLRQHILEAEPNNLDYHSELAGCYNDLGLALTGVGQRTDREQAVAMFLKAIEHQDEAVRRGPRQVARYRLLLSYHYFNLANAYLQLGRLAEAVAAGKMCPQSTPKNADMLFRYVRILAIAAVSVAGGEKELTTEQQWERDKYLDEAVATLREAIRCGYKDVVRIKKHNLTGFELLNGREDVKELVRDLERSLPGPKSAAPSKP